ncbi:Dynein heavy chain 17 [Phytophthora cinnamomi]|uniref:Dynein heavy chain 17 n=1 Tax=Phytophthora cinnamomi TaxID=4785 RepID=UPI003559F4E9|nr:Dynein heavy chain 17 [Phytophthora cinnamomi]
MLRHGKKLIQRVQVFDVTAVPGFKWKALVPFLQNEHFQPKFLAQFSCAASSMCAWVFSVLRAAQQQDYERLGLHTSSGLDAGGDEDRLELLSELEVDAAPTSPEPSKDNPTSWNANGDNEGLLPPLQRSRSSKRVSIGNAEVLFINENQPVMMSTPRGSSRSSSRRSESPVTTSKKSNFTVTSLHSGGESNALLRTSPWTYRGVVYFVSFFLQQVKERLQQQDEEESADEPDDRRLMIKIYEPMSSVESQMSVDTEDLRQDFGEQALVAFQSGQYRTLCDLMLQQLDRMMGTKAAPPTPPQPPKDTIPTAAGEAAVESPLLQDGGRKQASAVDLLLQDSDGDYEDRVDRPELRP